jgi:acyl-[acyl-carrier-protein] desaturase
MQVIVPAEESPNLEGQRRAEVLQALEPKAREMMASHLSKRRLWFPSDFLPADEQMTEDDEAKLARLRERARAIPDPVRVALVLNLLTEEGLPHFHRLLAQYLGDESVWHEWNNMWTAEEDRHGAILRDYARDARIFRMREVEMMQFAYQNAGFYPGWDRDPLRVFAYTSLQERATQYTHRNTGKMVGQDEPVLLGITTQIAADEARHFIFYRQLFKEAIEMVPEMALQSLNAILTSFEMPGAAMPTFNEMSEVVRRAKIFGPWEYKEIVEEALAFWKVDVLTGLNEVGRKAQEMVLRIPQRLQKIAEYVERRATTKAFSFEFIYSRAFTMG